MARRRERALLVVEERAAEPVDAEAFLDLYARALVLEASGGAPSGALDDRAHIGYLDTKVGSILGTRKETR
jgi:hypothetical protein